MNFLYWMKTVRVQGGTCANWLRPGALGILPSRPYVFSNKVINRDQQMVDAPSINAFKSKLVYIRDNRMGFFMD